MNRNRDCIKKVGKLLVIASIVGVMLSGCGGGGGGGGGGGTTTTKVTGVASKGPLSGATVCAYAITAGAKGAALGSCAANIVNGNYSINLGTYTGPVLFEATGGTYTDEATGTTVSLASPLRSMLSSVNGGASRVAITALTELAFQEASLVANGLTSTNIQAAVANVQANFGVADIVDTLPVDALNVPTTATAAQKTYALALAAVSQYQNGQPVGTSIANSLQIFQTCLAAPATDCGTGTTSVVANLNTALTTFQSGHPAFSGLPSPVLKFGSQPTDSLVKYDTITIAGLNRRNQKGALGLYNSAGDTLNIESDGTYTFTTPITAAARLHTISVQPAGNACQFTKLRQDHFDPYSQQLITSSTSDVYCFESPCGSLVSLGQAPAPNGLTVTQNTDSTVSFSWKKDAWAFDYRIYYGTDPIVVTTNPITGNAVYQNEVVTPDFPMKVPLNANYYYVITSRYMSPADLADCQSKASAAVSPTLLKPTVTSMSPTQGAAGATVTITGANFSTTSANNAVMFNGVQATVTAATATSLTVTVPVGATTGKITVTTDGGTATSVGSFTVGAAAQSTPVITSIDPIMGAVGATVTLTGANFSTTPANNTVKFNGTQATVTSATATSLTVTVPSGATTGTVTVTTAGGTATSAGSFTVTAASAAPSVTSADLYVLGNQAWSPIIYGFNSNYMGNDSNTAYAVTLCDWRNQPGAYGSGFGIGWRVPTKTELLTLSSSGYYNWSGAISAYYYDFWSSTLGTPIQGYPTQVVVNITNSLFYDAVSVSGGGVASTICVRPN